MIKSIIHEFDPVIYPVKILVTISYNTNAIRDRFVWKYDTETEIYIDYNESDAITGLVRHKQNNFIGILIVFKNKTVCNIKTIAHEASHAADDIWIRIGEKEAGREAHAYLVGWISECIEIAKKHKPNSKSVS